MYAAVDSRGKCQIQFIIVDQPHDRDAVALLEANVRSHSIYQRESSIERGDYCLQVQSLTGVIDDLRCPSSVVGTTLYTSLNSRLLLDKIIYKWQF